MKKLLAVLGAIAFAATAAFGTPNVAKAVQFQSPMGQEATAPEGASACIVMTDEAWGSVTSFEALDSADIITGYQKPAPGGKYVGAFRASIDDVDSNVDRPASLGLRVSVGQEYAGRNVTVYYFFAQPGMDAGGNASSTATVSQWGGFDVPFFVNKGDNVVGFAINIEPAGAPVEDEKPISDTVASEQGSSLTVVGNANTQGSITGVVATNKVASNYKPVSGNVVLGSFEVTGDATDFILKYTVDKKYAGMTAMLYVEHEDGTTAVQTAQVAEDGTVTFAMDRLSVYTLVVDTDGAASGAAGDTEKSAAKKDTGSKSPQTGVRSIADAAAPAFAVAAVIAGGALLALRKVNGR